MDEFWTADASNRAYLAGFKNDFPTEIVIKCLSSDAIFWPVDEWEALKSFVDTQLEEYRRIEKEKNQ